MALTEKQIEWELHRLAVLFGEGKKDERASVSFEEFAEEWFENYAKLNLKGTTYAKQRQLRKRVYPAIGGMPIGEITTHCVQSFINSLACDGVNEKTGKPLARKSMIHYLSFISTVLEYAVKMDIIPDNPCRRVTIPKGAKKERKILTMQETERLFALLQDAPLKYRVFFTLDLYTGLRRGEMLGLEWRDINFKTGVIHVERTSNYTKERGVYTDTTKTESSVRYLKVPKSVIDLLKVYKAERERMRSTLAPEWRATDRLFITAYGAPMSPQTPYCWLKHFCERNNIPFYGIHQFRHLHTSILIGAGIDPTTVSGILGHSQVSTTLNLYSHMFQENQAKACDAVAQALDFGSKKKKKK